MLKFESSPLPSNSLIQASLPPLLSLNARKAIEIKMSKTAVYSSKILHHLLYPIICLFLTNQYSFMVVSQSELGILLRIKEEWGNQRPLQLWNDTTSPCTWPGIRCSRGGTVTGILLRSQSITGPIPYSICELKNLTVLDLGNNTIGGGFPTVLYNCASLQMLDLSYNLFAGGLPNDIANLSPNNLQHLNLDTNSFSGEIPQGLWTLPRILTLVLSNNYRLSGQLPGQLPSTMIQLKINNNQLSGEIPVTVGNNWRNLEVFEASNNSLSGSIPVELTNLSCLQTLNLDGNNLHGELPSRIISWTNLNTLKLCRNQLSGSIPPALASLLALNFLDLSYNQLSGQIPPGLGLVYHLSLNLSFNRLTGKIPNGCDSVEYRTAFLNNTSLCSQSGALDLPRCSINKTENNQILPSKYLVLIIVFGVVATLPSVYFSWSMILGLRKPKRKNTQEILTNVTTADGQVTSWELTSFQRHLHFTQENILPKLIDEKPIGSGGSGHVYRIPINGLGGAVAVKRISCKKITNEKQFHVEVEILSRIRHVNIVKLLCCISSDHDSKLLVYEYMENQSLDKWIHKRKRKLISSKGSGPVHSGALDWPTRLRVAIGAAQGLTYMHNDCLPPIIHRDVKSSNILLDSQFNAKIGDFGFAKMFTKRGGESQTVSNIVGTHGYMDPEYRRKTKVSTLTDVFSFGVVLLELVTGKGPLDGGEEYLNLAQWALKHYREGKPIVDAFDEELKRDCYLEEMTNVFFLGLICTNSKRSSRPYMKEVLELLQMILKHEAPTPLFSRIEAIANIEEDE